MPGAERRRPAPPKGRLGRAAPRPSRPGPRKAGVTSLSRPGQEKWGRRQVRRRGALGPGQREPRRGVGCGRGRGKEQSRRWGRLGPGDVSPANNTLKEECGNGEKFERVVCWSFDQLSVTFGRRETWVCVFSCARWLGVSLARKTALYSNPHGKS